MSTKRDHLDDAIDAAVSLMVRTESDEAFAAQIINGLPARSMWDGWLFQSWAPRIAMIAVIVAAGIIWDARGSRESNAVIEPLAFSQPLSAPVTFVAAARERLERNRTMPLEHLELLEPVEPVPSTADFEFSLPGIEAVAALQVDPVAPASLSEDAPLTLAPLAIADLPMAENISPR